MVSSSRDSVTATDPGKERLRLILAALFLCAVPLILFAPALFGGKMLWGADIQTLEFPFKIAARRSLAAHQWPLWMPELLGGMPGIAGTNLVFLYPSELFLCLIGAPAHAAFGIDAAMQVALAGLGMLFFTRRLGASLGAATLAGLCYALSGSQVSILYAGHINNIKAISAIPWVFWAAHKAFYERRQLAWAACGAFLALQILGIGMQIFAYTILGLGAFAAWMAWSLPESERPAALKSTGLGLAIAAAFCVLLSAPQLLPSLEYKPYSWRQGFSYEDFTSWSFHPKESLGWIVPGFYGWREPTYHGDWPFCLSTEYFGILPWILAGAGLATLWGKSRGIVRFLAGLAVASFLIGIGKWTPMHLIFYHLPVYSGFRTWTRFLCLLTFAVCSLAALGWDSLFGERAAKTSKLALWLSAAAALLSMACLMASDGAARDAAAILGPKLGATAQAQAADLIRSSAGKAFALAASLSLIFWAWKKTATLPLVLLLGAALGLQAWDSSDMLSRFVVFQDPAQITTRPDFLQALPSPDSVEPWRILETPGVWQQNSGIFYGLEDVQGYHGVQMAAPRRLMEAMQSRQFDWINLMGARYLLSPQAIGVPGLKLLKDGPVKVYANPYAMPRAFLAASTRPVPDDDAAYRLMGDPGFHPQSEACLIQGPALQGKPGAKGSVAWIQRTPNAFSLQVDTAQPSCLVLAQTWYPGWHAAVDGVETPVLKADGALQGLLLQPGKHKVDFEFRAPMLSLGLGLFGFGILLLGGLAWLEAGRSAGPQNVLKSSL
jgi:hypothetical protein